MTDVIKITGVALFIVVSLIVWRCAGTQETKTGITETTQYDEVEGIINSVYPSGRSHKRSTLINVSYTYDNQHRRANLRREGYKEGTYHKGDTIAIRVNRSDPDEIK